MGSAWDFSELTWKIILFIFLMTIIFFFTVRAVVQQWKFLTVKDFFLTLFQA